MLEPISDALWAKIEPFLPPEPDYSLGGRPRIGDRKALNGILHVFATSVAWNKLPQELDYGSGMSCRRRLLEWEQAGVWAPIQQTLKEELPGAQQINWSRAKLRAEEDAQVEGEMDRAPDVPDGASTQTFGSWLKECRRALDLTQEELARRVGCS